VALVGVALGALVYAWSRRLVSPEAGWLSLVLFVFSPTFLAHGPLVTSDMTAALFFTAAAGAIWAAMHRVTPARVLGASVLVAGCALSKLSGPILAPVALIMLAVRVIDGRPLPDRIPAPPSRVRQSRASARRPAQRAPRLRAGGVGLVWASYGFRYTPSRQRPQARTRFSGQVRISRVVGRALDRTATSPAAEVSSTASLLHAVHGNSAAAFLNGQFATTGWW
jgi:hypothetical protein